MAKYGYARVSTSDQDLTIQRNALKSAGCEIIREEKVSATSRDGRDELILLMEFLRQGDTLVVTRIDRLARSVRDLSNIVHELRERDINLMVTEQQIDTSTASGAAFLQMLAVFAEFETNLRKERQAEGIIKAKAAGKYKGGKTKIDVDEVLRLKAGGMGATAISRELGIAVSSVYRLLN